jgi:amino acid transporter
MHDVQAGADPGQKPRDIGVAGAFSIGIGGIVGGGSGPISGGGGAALMAVGALLATVSAINADFFRAAKLPVMLARERQMPQRYARAIWGRHPAALGLVAALEVLIVLCVDLHAISAVASAGFLIVFAMVNVGNAKLAHLTGSRRWVSMLARQRASGRSA